MLLFAIGQCCTKSKWRSETLRRPRQLNFFNVLTCPNHRRQVQLAPGHRRKDMHCMALTRSSLDLSWPFYIFRQPPKWMHDKIEGFVTHERLSLWYMQIIPNSAQTPPRQLRKRVSIATLDQTGYILFNARIHGVRGKRLQNDASLGDEEQTRAKNKNFQELLCRSGFSWHLLSNAALIGALIRSSILKRQWSEGFSCLTAASCISELGARPEAQSHKMPQAECTMDLIREASFHRRGVNKNPILGVSSDLLIAGLDEKWDATRRSSWNEWWKN